MTKKSYKKSEIRARMAETGEAYLEAARALAAEAEAPEATSAPEAATTEESLSDDEDAGFGYTAEEWDDILYEKKADLGELSLFTERIAVLLETGLQFRQALAVAAPHTEDRILKEAVEYVLTEHKRGVDLLAAVELRPKAFRGIFLSMLTSVTQTGYSVSEAMRSLSKLYRSEFEMEQSRKH
jgi:type II secretory pathway component PulF